MKIISDLQIHSKYSRAVSDKMNIEEIYRWSVIKGINLVATGDWTHPLRIREIKEKLQETERGTLTLRKEFASKFPNDKFQMTNQIQNLKSKIIIPEFLLATEISSIYSEGGKTRRVHNLLWVPTLSSAEKIIEKLLKLGCNLSADGRPIVGLTSKQIVEIALSVDEKSLIIPAHAWTPWFALYGSKSGFDSIEECFGEYSKHIFAIETGLSSDPGMNWRIGELDNRSIVSFSDAHSGPKMGREATVFELKELTYDALYEAVISSGTNFSSEQNSSSQAPRQTTSSSSKLSPSDSFNKIAYTIEFYPEHGKYHFDGHRVCGVRYSPEETRKKGTTCPVCGRALTVGVEFRVEEIASRSPVKPEIRKDNLAVMWMHHPEEKHPPFISMVPLIEILGEVYGVGTGSKKVVNEYEKLTENLGTEFDILLKKSPAEMRKTSGSRISEAIQKVRSRNIFVDPGYDGVFGKVKVWKSEDDEVYEKKEEQISLF